MLLYRLFCLAACAFLASATMEVLQFVGISDCLLKRRGKGGCIEYVKHVHEVHQGPNGTLIWIGYIAAAWLLGALASACMKEAWPSKEATKEETDEAPRAHVAQGAETQYKHVPC